MSPQKPMMPTAGEKYVPFKPIQIKDRQWPNKVIAKPTDEVKGMPWLKVGVGGAEYGALTWKDGEQFPKLGDRLEIYCTNLDQSTNAFDRYYIAQGDKIVDVWPIMGRSGAAQR